MRYIRAASLTTEARALTMRDKSEVLAAVCDALLAGDLEKASAMAIADYPFVATTNAGRAYSEVQSLRIFRRDSFLDRYTGTRPRFSRHAPVAVEDMPADFPAHPNWKRTLSHAVYWELFPTVDHEMPVARGGTDSDENWVTTSMLRNSAKSDWTLEELGWTVRPIDPSPGWDGLIRWFNDYPRDRPEHLSDAYIARWHRAAKATVVAT